VAHAARIDFEHESRKLLRQQSCRMVCDRFHLSRLKLQKFLHDRVTRQLNVELRVLKYDLAQVWKAAHVLKALFSMRSPLRVPRACQLNMSSNLLSTFALKFDVLVVYL
jgi:hypothetical protein